MKLETINSRAAKRLVIWAHSECRSTAVLYSEAKRLAEARGMEVTMCLWGLMPMREERLVHAHEFVRVGDDLEKGRAILSMKGGRESIQVFCLYQNSAVWRELMKEAKAGGARVVVYAEAPCEMCLGFKGFLKRLYYRWVLPHKMRGAVQAADALAFARGEMHFKPMKERYYRMPRYLRAFIYFLIRYFFNGGILDGYAGWMWNFWQGLWYRCLVDREISKLRRAAR